MKKRAVSTVFWWGALFVAATAFAQPAIVLEDGGLEFPDGTVLESANHQYSHVLVVAKDGAQFTSIQDAIQSIVVGPVPPDLDNRFLIWVAPGVYEEQVVMIPYVDIRGAGKKLVTIRHGGGQTVTAGNETELSHLTVTNVGGGGDSVALKTDGPIFKFHARHVLLEASGGADCRGLWIAEWSGVTLESVEIRAVNCNDSYGVYNEGIEMRGHRVSVSGVAEQRGYGIWGAQSLSLTRSVIGGQGCLEGVGIATGAGAIGVALEDSLVRGGTSGDCPGTDTAYGIKLIGAGGTLYNSIVTGGTANSNAAVYLVADAQGGASGLEVYSSHLGYADLAASTVALAAGDSSSTARLFHSGLSGAVQGVPGLPFDVHCFGCYTWDPSKRGIGLDEGCLVPPS